MSDQRHVVVFQAAGAFASAISALGFVEFGMAAATEDRIGALLSGVLAFLCYGITISLFFIAWKER